MNIAISTTGSISHRCGSGPAEAEAEAEAEEPAERTATRESAAREIALDTNTPKSSTFIEV
jgi:hypothetical protein